MNEQYIIDKMNETVSEIRNEYNTEYDEPSYLLTHLINLECLASKYFAFMEILIDNTDVDVYDAEYEKNKALFEAVATRIDNVRKVLNVD